MAPRSRTKSWPLGLALVALGATACSKSPDVAKRPNILLITVDTLRADHLQPYGYQRPTSPQLAELAQGAMVFEDAQSTAPWTLPSLASLVTGLPAAAHGCRSFYSSLAPSYSTLAEQLLAGGYDTAAVVSHVFLGRPYGLHQGFVHFDDELVLELTRSDQAISSKAVSDKGLAYLDAKAAAGGDEPWFLWLHYFDPHSVYQAHPDQVGTFGTKRPMDLYDGEVAFTDRHIGRILDGLGGLGLTDDTVVVFTSDHGEEFQDHGGLDHGHTLHEELLHLPLIIRVPGEDPGRHAGMVRIIDVPATILDLATLPAAPESFGQSLRPLIEGRAGPDLPPAIAELDRNTYRDQISLTTTETKVILNRQTGKPELYDRVGDRSEQHNLAPAKQAETQALLEELAILQQAAVDVAARHTDRVDQNLGTPEIENLSGLGYVDDKE
ncbi:MAG: sulfatase [Planctomycetota bacterium]|nr:sulfatase [Planctomycetota bacterium]MDG2143746.1 sulfatase [Planctomycetota bacterium]